MGSIGGVCSKLYIYLVLFCSLSHVRVSKLVSVCVSDWSCTKIGDALVGSLNTTVLLCYTLSALLGSLYFWKLMHNGYIGKFLVFSSLLIDSSFLC